MPAYRDASSRDAPLYAPTRRVSNRDQHTSQKADLPDYIDTQCRNHNRKQHWYQIRRPFPRFMLTPWSTLTLGEVRYPRRREGCHASWASMRLAEGLFWVRAGCDLTWSCRLLLTEFLTGPLVYGIAYCPSSFSDELKDVGFAGVCWFVCVRHSLSAHCRAFIVHTDSKTLTAERRDALLAALIEHPDQLGETAQQPTGSVLRYRSLSTAILEQAGPPAQCHHKTSRQECYDVAPSISTHKAQKRPWSSSRAS